MLGLVRGDDADADLVLAGELVVGPVLLHREAELEDGFDVDQWLESNDMTWPFSFASICQALDMEPEYLRRGLKQWADRASSDGMRGQVYRFPFRRVNGRRHSINAKRERRRTRRAS